MMLRKVVVLPAPLRPTRQTSSPAATDRLMPLRMRLPSISTFKFDRLSIKAAFFKLCSKSWAGSNHGRYHGRIREEDIGRHIRKHHASLQRDDAMRIALDQVHVVLDLDDGTHARRAGGGHQHLHDAMLVPGRNPAGRLGEQNDGGIERKGAGDVEQFLLALRKCRSDGDDTGGRAEYH